MAACIPQATAYIKQTLFHEWHLASELTGDSPIGQLQFGINLATLVECLKIVDTSSSAVRAAGIRIAPPLTLHVRAAHSWHRGRKAASCACG